MKKKLTDNERKTYEFIRSRVRQGIPPSVREICLNCGFRSTSTAHRMVAMLTEKGYLEKADHLNRAIRLAGESRSVKVPLIEKTDPSLPLTAAELVACYIDVTPPSVTSGELFAVRAADDIPEKAILSGDIAVAETKRTCSVGDAAVFADPDGTVSVRPFSEGDTPLGKVTAVIRYL